MLILGFGNKARNGKDTAAEAILGYYQWQNDLKRKHGLGLQGLVKVDIFKYATSLYQEVNDELKYGEFWKHRVVLDKPTKTVYKLPEWVQPESNPVKSALAPFGKHPTLLQWWGTEYRRAHFGQDYWIKKLYSSIPDNLDIALITDVRFIDEAEAVKQRGGYTIQVQRLNKDGTQYLSPDRSPSHRSETELDTYNWDFYLKIPDNHAALTGQFAITLTDYLRVLHGKTK